MAQPTDQDKDVKKQKALDQIIDNLSADPKPAASADPKAPIKPPTPEQNAQSVADNIKKAYGGKFKPTHDQMKQELDDLKKSLEEKKIKQTDPNSPLSKEDQEKNTKIDKSIKKVEDAQAHFKDPNNFKKYQKNEEDKENAAKKAKAPEKPKKNGLQKMADAWGDLSGNLFGAWLKQIGNITLKGLWENIKQLPGKIASPFNEAYQGIKNLFGGGKPSDKSKGDDKKTNPTGPAKSGGDTTPATPGPTGPTGNTPPARQNATAPATTGAKSPTGTVQLGPGSSSATTKPKVPRQTTAAPDPKDPLDPNRPAPGPGLD